MSSMIDSYRKDWISSSSMRKISRYAHDLVKGGRGAVADIVEKVTIGAEFRDDGDRNIPLGRNADANEADDIGMPQVS